MGVSRGRVFADTSPIKGVWTSSKPSRLALFTSLAAQDLLHALEVVFGVHAHRVEGRFGGMDIHAVIEEAKLFQPLDTLQLRLRPQAELFQRLGRVRVESQMLAVAHIASTIDRKSTRLN